MENREELKREFQDGDFLDYEGSEKEEKLTFYKFQKMLSESVESLDLNTHKKSLLSKIKEVIRNDINSQFFILVSPHFGYQTTFYNKNNKSKKDFAQEVLNFIVEEIENGTLGELKQYSLTEQNNLELWLGNEHYLFFNYDWGVIEV